MKAPLLAACALVLGAAGLARAEIVLYDGLTPGAPQSQGWLSYGAVAVYYTAGPGTTVLDTTASSGIQAGFLNYNLFLTSFQNAAFPVLDRASGFAVSIDLKTLSESHDSDDRAGFSLIALGSDKKGIELGFWEDRIWAQSGADFRHAEETLTDTTAGSRRYTLTVHDDTYVLNADGSDILTGPVRDYSLEGPPYDRPSFVFIGDDTTSARGATEVARLAVALLEGPAASIADASTSEGDSGSHTLTLPVSLSAASAAPVIVAYATEPGSALAPLDYASTSGTLTFAPGVTSLPIAIAIRGDTLSEADETLTVHLSAPSGATIGRGAATGTIVDDDPLPTVAIADGQVREGNGGLRTVTLRLTLSTSSGRSVLVHYSTGGGTATPGTDYAAAAGVVTFPPMSRRASVAVPILGDRVAEASESFFVTLSAPLGATLGRAQARVTIVDDDGVRSPRALPR